MMIHGGRIERRQPRVGVVPLPGFTPRGWTQAFQAKKVPAFLYDSPGTLERGT